MKTLPFLRCVGGAWLLLGLAGAHAQTPTAHADAAAAAARAQESESLQREREAIDRALQQAEKGCYQRFAVEDCLREARRSAREARARVRQRQLVLDEAERRERAAQRLSEIQERESTRVPPTPPPSASAEPARRPTQADIDRQAQERARTQQDRRAAQQARQAQAREAAAQAEAAREKQLQKQQAAAEHKARVLKSQADKASAGQKPAAPLPPPP
ncbi:hypothetical protein B2J86_01415 [Acidovorax sp. SRB_14]|uniref:hypothetical protein n=1 Tax=Acidovorax sp. SRB_14 TaxID=1962699 RepID=UPI00146AD31D|nr:hypothetical protein [Acidovorax sp. SRB_14]NMM79602.1 hypothetical protein [Acidovorax sp. SRB_14]NMM89059.1 hypothetical protein [Rhodococcus sp. SRB_17]